MSRKVHAISSLSQIGEIILAEDGPFSRLRSPLEGETSATSAPFPNCAWVGRLSIFDSKSVAYLADRNRAPMDSRRTQFQDGNDRPGGIATRAADGANGPAAGQIPPNARPRLTTCIPLFGDSLLPRRRRGTAIPRQGRRAQRVQSTNRCMREFPNLVRLQKRQLTCVSFNTHTRRRGRATAMVPKKGAGILDGPRRLV